MGLQWVLLGWAAVGAALLLAALLAAGLIKLALDVRRGRISARDDLAAAFACVLPALAAAAALAEPQALVGAAWGALRLLALWSWAPLLFAADRKRVFKDADPRAKRTFLAWLALLMTLVGAVKTAGLTSERLLDSAVSGETTAYLTTDRSEEDLYLWARGPDGRLRGPEKIADSIGGTEYYGFKMAWTGPDTVEVSTTKENRPPFPAKLP